jgi:hypothetical protein
MILTTTKKMWARAWLCVILLLITGAHYFFYRFSSDPLNSYPVSQGLTFGCLLWTSVLWGAMWLRYGWARYLMITMICLAIAGFSLLAMLVRGDSVDPLQHLMKLAIFGILFYIAALVPLNTSSFLRHYMGPKTAGER